MAGKGFCVKIRLELHAITCPGVWLCPNGKIALRINSFGSTLESHRVSPIFPLLFHNEFNFKKTFTRLAALTDLQRILQQQSLYAELIQWLSPCNQPILLATFQTSLADLLYPVTYCKRLLPGVDVDLLMDPTKYFPGIIAPKIEISTKTVIEEVKTIYDANLDRPYIVNPKTIDSKVKRYIRVTSRYVWLRYFIFPPIVIFSKNPTFTGNDPSKVSSGKGRFVIVEPKRKLQFAISHSVETIRVTTWNTRVKANSLGPLSVTIRRNTDQSVGTIFTSIPIPTQNSMCRQDTTGYPPFVATYTSSTAAPSVSSTNVTFPTNATESLPTIPLIRKKIVRYRNNRSLQDYDQRLDHLTERKVKSRCTAKDSK